MIDDTNDPQLTAYALGELDGQEAEAMKARIEKDPVAKKYVEEIQATARRLEDELGREATPRLEVAERERLFAKTAGARRGFVWAISGGILAAAAASVVAFTVLLPRPTTEERLAELAQSPPPPATEIARHQVPVSEPVPAAPARKEMRPAEAKKDSLTAEAQSLSGYRFEGDPAKAEIPADKVAATSGKSMTATRGGGAMRAKGLGHSSFGGPMSLQAQQEGGADMNTEAYKFIQENAFKAAVQDALSTFSIDVDTASYANVRRFLVGGSLPPKDAVRSEELINYFSYAYPAPADGRPFSVTTEVAAAPWNAKHRLVRIGLKGKVTPRKERQRSNLVFLLDVSGSMNDANKLPLVQKSMKLLVENLDAKDHVAIVVYAGATGVVLPSTRATEKSRIMQAIDELRAGGGTDGASGIELAYREAQKNFIRGGINRVILATDGDFNIGRTSEGELTRLIQEKAKSGVFLSVLGFGMGNYKDSTMQSLANKGNGNHAYIDSLREARKVLVEQAGGTLNTIAKDVKIQVEFNPRHVQQYRLIGYEKRMLNHTDFNDDQKDAGEIGEGHTVTALYEVIPVGVTAPAAGGVDALKYQVPAAAAPSAAGEGELMTVKLRYKQPDGDKSQLLEHVVAAGGTADFDAASGDMKFAAAVAGFAMILRDSEFKNDLKLSRVQEIAAANAKDDDYRQEFVELVKKARSLAPAK